MASPFEELAGDRDRAACLPADAWLHRRQEGMQAHKPSVEAVVGTVMTMGSIVFDGRIATDLISKTEGNMATENPSVDLARVDIGILPTGIRRRWADREEVFTPDAALGVSIILKDMYEYSRGSAESRGCRPRPLGQVQLTVFARSWGRLTLEEELAIMGGVVGENYEYGDSGFDRCGTYLQIHRTVGQPLLTRSQVEVFMTPLARHVLDYFEIMGLRDPGEHQPDGNFSTRRKSADRA